MLGRIVSKLKRQAPIPIFTPQAEPPPSGLDLETIRDMVAKVPFWWHHIELGYGLVTPGHQGGPGQSWVSREVCESLQLPDDLTGKRVLDIGAWDGYFSFACERRGANPILAIDNHYRLEREGKELDAGRCGFDTAAQILASKVEYRQMDVMDISAEEIGVFDVVLFLGVLYHLRDPLMALEKVAAVTREMMILETHIELNLGKGPRAVFYEHAEQNADPTNWWGPNAECVEAMTRAVGFSQVERITQFGNRLVLHAYK